MILFIVCFKWYSLKWDKILNWHKECLLRQCINPFIDNIRSICWRPFWIQGINLMASWDRSQTIQFTVNKDRSHVLVANITRYKPWWVKREGFWTGLVIAWVTASPTQKTKGRVPEFPVFPFFFSRYLITSWRQLRAVSAEKDRGMC